MKREQVQFALVVAVGAIVSIAWLTAFPTKSTFDRLDILLESVYLTACAVGLFLVLRMSAPLLATGLSVLAFALLFDLLEEFTTNPNALGVSTQIALTLAGVALTVVGLALHYLRLRNDLAAVHDAREATRAAEQRYGVILDDLPELICRFESDTTITFINQAYADYFGKSRDALVGTRFLALIPESDHGPLLEHLAELDASQPVQNIEHQVVAADGGIRWQEWTDRALLDDNGAVVGFQSIGRDVTVQKRDDERRRLLNRELNHRVRNAMSSLGTLIEMGRRTEPDVESFADAIGGRVRAMTIVHNLLSRSQWAAHDLRALVVAFEPPECGGRIHLDGPDVEIPAEQLTPLGMILHELFTNSQKHGAHRADDGAVSISWRIDRAPDGSRNLDLAWKESGGSPIESEPVAGVGTDLIDGLTRSDLRGTSKLAFPRDGAEHRFSIELVPAPETLSPPPSQPQPA